MKPLVNSAVWLSAVDNRQTVAKGSCDDFPTTLHCRNDFLAGGTRCECPRRVRASGRKQVLRRIGGAAASGVAGTLRIRHLACRARQRRPSAGLRGEAEPSKTLSQQDIASSGITAFTGAQVDPPQCRAVLIPPHVEPSVGTQAAGVRGQGDQGNIYVVAMRLPQPVRASQPPAGCDRVSVSGSPRRVGPPNVFRRRTLRASLPPEPS
ncbi:hypothetical protein I552_5094 [Mycobacterium xenopi 3993]|nr:hypothetical protein I552_5094 [Mycobacterium xenopi 3993]